MVTHNPFKLYQNTTHLVNGSELQTWYDFFHGSPDTTHLTRLKNKKLESLLLSLSSIFETLSSLSLNKGDFSLKVWNPFLNEGDLWFCERNICWCGVISNKLIAMGVWERRRMPQDSRDGLWEGEREKVGGWAGEAEHEERGEKKKRKNKWRRRGVGEIVGRGRKMRKTKEKEKVVGIWKVKQKKRRK